MFKMSEIKELIKLLDQSNIHELEIEHDGSKIAIRKPNRTETVMVSAPAHTMFPQAAHAPISIPAAAAPQAIVAATPAIAQTSEVVDANLHKITSPMVGTFYLAPAPTSPNFVNKGDSVTAKSVVCIVEAMKLMNEIEAEVDGEVIEVLVENGQLVEFGQPLFLVRKN